MKKVSFSLKVGIIGAKISHKEIILNYLKQKSLSSDSITEDFRQEEFFLLLNEIPFKLKVFSSLNFEDILEKVYEIESLDVVLLVVNATETVNSSVVNKDLFNDFKKQFYFDGISALVGILPGEKYEIINNTILQTLQANLIRIARELDLLYCYLIKDIDPDISQIFEAIANDYSFKFKFSSPELYEFAKAYGNEVLKRNSP